MTGLDYMGTITSAPSRPWPWLSAMRVAAAVITTAGLALLAAACGSPTTHVAQVGTTTTTTTTEQASPPGSSSSSAGGSTVVRQMLAYSRCMRSHGEQNYPDPNSQGQIKQQLIASGIDTSSPQFQTASGACRHALPNGGNGMTPAQFAQMKAEALVFSHCIQAHGFKNYPDPGSDGREPDPSSVGIDQNTPKWQAAHSACFHP